MAMMRKNQVCAIAALAAAFLGACSSQVEISSLPDGQYSGKSAVESDGSYGVIEFDVSAGQVTKAHFTAYDADGTPHDENYGLGADGKPHDATFYQRAQNAIAAEKKYVEQFAEVSDHTAVDSIAGASVSYRMFQSAVENAISSAQTSRP